VNARNGLLFLMFFPLTAWAQTPGSLANELHLMETHDWVIFGRATDMKGKPLGGVIVRVDVGTGGESVRALKTDLQGEFRTQYTFDMNLTKRLTVKLVATKPDYTEAHATTEFAGADKTSGIELILRESTPDPDQVSLDTLVGTLAPRLRQDALKTSGAKADRREKDLARGCEELIDRHNAARAVPLLTKGVAGAPSCVECHLLLALASLEAGSWTDTMQQIEEAAKLNDAATAKRPEPALIKGMLESWRGQASQSADSFQKALEVDPDNALALQEMGRIQVEQSNWGAADQYLERALRAGAGDEARLLRVRALLEEGDNAEAGREMDQYTSRHEVSSLSPEARTLYVQVKDRLRLERYSMAKSVLTESPQDLIKAMPELKGIRVTSDQDELAMILKNVGEGVESFFKNFPNTVSLEQVHQERLGKDGKVTRSRDQDFQYLLLARREKWGVGIEENRATPAGERAALGGYNEGMMLTAGFASVSLLFYPAYQNGAKFRYLGRQSLGGKNLYVVAFAQNPQTARTEERFSTDNASALILTQGVAWIDPTNYQIVRIRTDLLAPQPKVRLQRQTTEIQFQEVSFKEVASALWLPQEVSVTVDWKGRVYRNWHRYSDFKLFNVETKEKRKSLPLPGPPVQEE
jgi:tetratricopeptide (TPR) repeat protein